MQTCDTISPTTRNNNNNNNNNNKKTTRSNNKDQGMSISNADGVTRKNQQQQQPYPNEAYNLYGAPTMATLVEEDEPLPPMADDESEDEGSRPGDLMTPVSRTVTPEPEEEEISLLSSSMTRPDNHDTLTTMTASPTKTIRSSGPLLPDADSSDHIYEEEAGSSVDISPEKQRAAAELLAATSPQHHEKSGPSGSAVNGEQQVMTNDDNGFIRTKQTTSFRPPPITTNFESPTIDNSSDRAYDSDDDDDDDDDDTMMYADTSTRTTPSLGSYFASVEAREQQLGNSAEDGDGASSSPSLAARYHTDDDDDDDDDDSSNDGGNPRLDMSEELHVVSTTTMMESMEGEPIILSSALNDTAAAAAAAADLLNDDYDSSDGDESLLFHTDAKEWEAAAAREAASSEDDDDDDESLLFQPEEGDQWEEAEVIAAVAKELGVVTTTTTMQDNTTSPQYTVPVNPFDTIQQKIDESNEDSITPLAASVVMGSPQHDDNDDDGGSEAREQQIDENDEDAIALAAAAAAIAAASIAIAAVSQGDDPAVDPFMTQQIDDDVNSAAAVMDTQQDDENDEETNTVVPVALAAAGAAAGAIAAVTRDDGNPVDPHVGVTQPTDENGETARATVPVTLEASSQHDDPVDQDAQKDENDEQISAVVPVALAAVGAAAAGAIAATQDSDPVNPHDGVTQQIDENAEVVPVTLEASQNDDPGDQDAGQDENEEDTSAVVPVILAVVGAAAAAGTIAATQNDDPVNPLGVMQQIDKTGDGTSAAVPTTLDASQHDDPVDLDVRHQDENDEETSAVVPIALTAVGAAAAAGAIAATQNDDSVNPRGVKQQINETGDGTNAAVPVTLEASQHDDPIDLDARHQDENDEETSAVVPVALAAVGAAAAAGAIAATQNDDPVNPQGVTQEHENGEDTRTAAPVTLEASQHDDPVDPDARHRDENDEETSAVVPVALAAVGAGAAAGALAATQDDAPDVRVDPAVAATQHDENDEETAESATAVAVVATAAGVAAVAGATAADRAVEPSLVKEEDANPADANPQEEAMEVDTTPPLQTSRAESNDKRDQLPKMIDSSSGDGSSQVSSLCSNESVSKVKGKVVPAVAATVGDAVAIKEASVEQRPAKELKHDYNDERVIDIEAGPEALASYQDSTPYSYTGPPKCGRLPITRLACFFSITITLLLGAMCGLVYFFVRELTSPSNLETVAPADFPSISPISLSPTTPAPSLSPSDVPTAAPSSAPPTLTPSRAPITPFPTGSAGPSATPSSLPSLLPTRAPSLFPSTIPTIEATKSKTPSHLPSLAPSINPVKQVQNYILDQGYSSPESLAEPDSPQSKAVAFMAEDSLQVPTASIFARAATPEETEWVERYAFAVFYYELRGDNWLNPLNFVDHSLQTCEWFSVVPGGAFDSFGVLCSPDDGTIVLRIANNNLSGSIASELGLVENLQVINLQQNTMVSGTIPDSLQNVTSLLQFNCIYCNLSGSLPNWIGERWTKLTALALTKNKMSGELPASMSQMSNLLLLALDDNFFGGTIDPLLLLTSLEFVYLEENNFSGTIDSNFFASAEGLTRLDISDNLFVGSVPIHLFGLENITTLDLNDNTLTTFEDAIAPSPLKLLAIHGNPIGGSFPSTTISNLQALTHLDITSTQFTGEMPSSFGELPNLSYLFLANTRFEPGPVPASYQNLTRLVDLSLKQSFRFGTFPEWVVNLQQLVLLDFHANSLTGSIPSAIGGMTSLEFLLLNRNDLTGSIPSSLSSLSSTLQIVFLEGNNLNGSLDPVCQSRPSLIAAVADCGGNFPEVECQCCNLCCSDADPTCNTEMDLLAQYDPQWESNYMRNGVYSFTEDFGILSRDAARGGNAAPTRLPRNRLGVRSLGGTDIAEHTKSNCLHLCSGRMRTPHLPLANPTS